MRVTALLVVVFLASRVGGQEPKTKEDTVKKEIERLQGTWNILNVSMFENGRERPFPFPKDLQMEIAGEAVLGIRDGKEAGRAAYKLDLTRTPKALEVTENGKTFPFVYHLDGDQLKLAILFRGFFETSERPASFDPIQGKDKMFLLVITLKKAKRSPPAKSEYEEETQRLNLEEFEKKSCE